ncbi:MAG: NfeD family protein [Christensenellales bacterium]|jgi:membrane-bound serine protease (ClpP class)
MLYLAGNSIFREIVLLFSEMGVVPAICLLAGLVLMIIEVFQPGFGIFGGLGAILTIIGIALRVADSGSANPFAILFLLLLFITLIITAAFIIMVKSSRYGWLKRTPFFEEGTAVNADFSEGTKDFSFLIGKKGITITNLRPAGFASIDGENYDVTAEGFFIEKDELIKVVAVEGIKITVKRVDEQ